MEQNRQDRLPWAIVLLIIVLCCLVAFASARIIVRARSANGFASVRSVQVGSISKLETLGDGFVYYDGGSLSKVSEEGEAMWSYKVGSDANFSAADAGIAAWTGKKLTLIDSITGETGYSGNMDADVLSAQCLSPRVRLECNPEIPFAPGEEHWLLDTSLEEVLLFCAI